MASQNISSAFTDLDDMFGAPVAPPLKKPCRATANWVGTLVNKAGVPRWQQQPSAIEQSQMLPAGFMQQPEAKAPVVPPHSRNQVSMQPSPMTWSSATSGSIQEATQPETPAEPVDLEDLISSRQDSLSFLASDWLTDLGFLDESLGMEVPAGLRAENGQVQHPPVLQTSEETRATSDTLHSHSGTGSGHAMPGSECHCQDCELLAQVRSEWQGPDPAESLGLGQGIVEGQPLRWKREGATEPPLPARTSSDSMQMSTGSVEGDGGLAGLEPMLAMLDGNGGQVASSAWAGRNRGFHAEVSSPRHMNGGSSGSPRSAAEVAVDQGMADQRAGGRFQRGGTRHQVTLRDVAEDDKLSSRSSSSTDSQQGNAGALVPGLPFFRRDDSLAKRLAKALGETYTPPPEAVAAAPASASLKPVADGNMTKLPHGDKKRTITQSHALLAQQVPASETPIGKQLLAFAEAIATDDDNRARFLMKKLKEEADVHGDSMQRVAFYFMEGLWARTMGLGLEQYAMTHLTPTKEITDCLVEINKKLPFVDFLAGISNATFMEAIEGESHIHILDLGIWHFNQWPLFMRALLNRPGSPPFLRITKLQLPPTGWATYRIPPIDFVEYKQTLVRVASSLGIPFEYQALQMNLESLTVDAIHVRPGEALLVYGAMRFHTLSDGSIIRSSPRDAALRTIRALEPKIFLLAEKQVDHNGPFFLNRFCQALDYYSTVFESLDHHMPRSSIPRQLFEKNLLGRDIVNVVACEGLQRISRCETLEKWRSRMKEAGFVQRPFKPRTKTQAWEALESYDNNWGVQEESGALMLTWKTKPLLAISTWRVAC